MRVLIVGVSTRAAAESAARAGFDVTALDAYADLDQHPSVRALSLPRNFGRAFSPDAIAAVTPGLSSDAVAYLSNLENHPEAVEALAAGRALWGNDAGVLRRVREPRLLADVFAARGIRMPRVVTSRPGVEQRGENARWLIKPRASGGGHGVRFWAAHEPVTRGHYLQEFIEGVPGSVVFVAADGRGVVLGTSRQLVGEHVFGVSGFRYCGSMLNAVVDEGHASAVSALVDVVSASFGVVGVCSIDFITTVEGLHPIEVNPRWSASVELVERAHGISIFTLHARACARKQLPQLDLGRSPTASATHGKAIVFARRNVVIPDTRRWLDDADVRDVPRPGDHIAAGQPICTVFAVGSDDTTCHAMLVERAERIYAQLI